ncbi:hypothetical protein Dsin_013213 [Dipteronia sinensis]|uniref:RNase H type-1 domain-containing protein n=1 Tax=Dipteronia sinensis TaxID=43782 RepID=A0AAE0AK12_9ROSI|nr:hypothetical protein Dsin_013213 [Dipteronia sinensis]
MIFKGVPTTVSQATDKVKFRVAWWYKYHGAGSKLSISTMLLNVKESCADFLPKQKKNEIAWNPPLGLVLKFNVDGSARGNPGNAGIGGVLIDNTGKVLGLFSEHVGILDSNSAEILAIHRAVSLCAESTSLIGKDVDIVSDSKIAVSWVNSEGFGSLNHVKLIYDIRSLLLFLGNTWVFFQLKS